MKRLSLRQNQILQQAIEQGRVEVELLAADFAVSAQTIRKDLNDLCNHQLLQRVHGGAIACSGNENFSYQARTLLAADAKVAIGRAVASEIANGTSLLLNLGTTVEQVAYALTDHSSMLVVTNNINVANIMRNCLGIQIMVAGGEVRRADGGIIGVAAREFIDRFKTDYAIIGTSAIDDDGAFLDYDFKEVAVSQQIIKNARRVILAADATKLERQAPVRVANLADIDIIVTDRPLPQKLQQLCAGAETKVVVAPPLTGSVAESSD